MELTSRRGLNLHELRFLQSDFPEEFAVLAANSSTAQYLNFVELPSVLQSAVSHNEELDRHER